MAWAGGAKHAGRDIVLDDLLEQDTTLVLEDCLLDSE